MPIIAVNPIPGQEEENANFLEKHGLAVSIKKNDDILEKLKDTIYNDEKLEIIKTNIQRYARPNSAVEIIKKIFED